jgi:hypothetical protein
LPHATQSTNGLTVVFSQQIRPPADGIPAVMRRSGVTPK